MKPASRAYKDRLKGHKHAVVALHTPEGPDGSRLISASADGMVRFWNVRQRERERKFIIEKPNINAHILCYFFSEESVFVGYDDSTFLAYNLATGALRFQMEGHSGSINAIDGDEKAIYSGSHDRTVRVWSPRSGECVLMFQFSDPISAVRLTPNSSDLYVGMWDKVLRRVDLRSHQVQEVLLASSEVIRAVLVTDSHLYVGGCDPVVRSWDKETLQWKSFQGHKGWVLGLRLYRNLLFSFSDDRTIKVWDQNTGKCVEEFHGHEDAVTAVEFVGDVMYSASLDHSIRTWDLREMMIRIEERAGMMQEDILSWKVYVFMKTIESRKSGKKGKKKKGKGKGKGKGKKRAKSARR